MIQKDTKRYSSDEVIKSLANKFPNHPTMVLPWPQFRLDKVTPITLLGQVQDDFPPTNQNCLLPVVLFRKKMDEEE